MENENTHQEHIESKEPIQQNTEIKPVKPAHNGWKIFIVIFLLVILGLAGWLGYQQFFTNKQSSKPKTVYTGSIKIGYIASWPGHLGLFLARDKGYFKEEGLHVELKKYDGGTPLLNDYVNGVLQGRADLTFDAIIEAYKGLDHKTILAIDYSNGADAIISSTNIKSFQDVKGKKFAFEKGSIEEFFTRYALQQNNLSINDIIPINLDAEKAAQALVRGEVDVAATFEPTASQVVSQIHGNKIFSSADAPGVITDILTFRSNFINQYPDTVQSIIKAYFKGIQYWKDHPADANQLIGKELGVSATDANTSLAGIKVLNLSDNTTAFTFAAGLQSLYGNMRQVGRFIVSQKTTSSGQIDTDSLIEPKFIRNLSNQ